MDSNGRRCAFIDRAAAACDVDNASVVYTRAEQWAEGLGPHDPTLYYPFYQGEYDPEGRLRTPRDNAFLFWLIPILGVENGQYVPLEYHAQNCE